MTNSTFAIFTSATNTALFWNDTTGNLTVGDNVTYNYIPYSQRPETYIVPLIFTAIFIVGTFGNGTLVYIFLRNKSMRSIPNTFIISLSIGDLVVIVGSVPFISTVYTVESWPYGTVICKLSEFLKDVSIGVTVLTLTVLSIDRYLAIALPIKKHRHQHSKNLTLFIAGGIWCASFALAIPGAYYSYILHVKVSGDKYINICFPFPIRFLPWYPRTMILLKFFIFYAIPLLVIGSFYAFMARHLLLTLRTNVGKNDSHIKHLRARSKVAKIVLALVIIFAICFFPNHVFMMWFYFHPNAINRYNRFWHIWKMCGYVLSFANSCVNPIALYFISGVFRNFFKRYLFCCCCAAVRRRKGRILFRTTYKSSSRSNSRITASTKV